MKIERRAGFEIGRLALQLSDDGLYYEWERRLGRETENWVRRTPVSSRAWFRFLSGCVDVDSLFLLFVYVEMGIADRLGCNSCFFLVFRVLL